MFTYINWPFRIWMCIIKIAHFEFCPRKQFQVSELCWMPLKNNATSGNPMEAAKVVDETRSNLEGHFNIWMFLKSMLKSCEISHVKFQYQQFVRLTMWMEYWGYEGIQCSKALPWDAPWILQCNFYLIGVHNFSLDILPPNYN